MKITVMVTEFKNSPLTVALNGPDYKLAKTTT